MIENETFTQFLDLLKLLIRKPSVVGAEHPFFLTLKRELDEIGIATTLYEGLLVAEGNTPDSGMLSAHIDRHGLICTGVNEFQYAAFMMHNRSDLTGDSISEQTYTEILERFANQNVLAYEPWSGSYLGMGVINSAALCPRRRNLIFQVDNLSHLFPGTPLAFVDALRQEDGLLQGQLDNVISAAAIIWLYKRGYQGRAFFTAQEESGRSWRHLLEWFLRYDINSSELLVLDTSPYARREEADLQQVVFRHRDANAVFDSPLHVKLENCCEELAIPYGYKDSYIRTLNTQLEREGKKTLSLGSTEMGRIVAATQGGINGTTLQIPTTGYHTTAESASVEAVKAFLSLLQRLYVMK